MLEQASTLDSGFSSYRSGVNSTGEYNPDKYEPDYNRIKRGYSYWFNNAGEVGQFAIARSITSIGLLRAVNL